MHSTVHSNVDNLVVHVSMGVLYYSIETLRNAHTACNFSIQSLYNVYSAYNLNWLGFRFLLTFRLLKWVN